MHYYSDCNISLLTFSSRFVTLLSFVKVDLPALCLVILDSINVIIHIPSLTLYYILLSYLSHGNFECSVFLYDIFLCNCKNFKVFKNFFKNLIAASQCYLCFSLDTVVELQWSDAVCVYGSATWGWLMLRSFVRGKNLQNCCCFGTSACDTSTPPKTRC